MEGIEDNNGPPPAKRRALALPIVEEDPQPGTSSSVAPRNRNCQAPPDQPMVLQQQQQQQRKCIYENDMSSFTNHIKWLDIVRPAEEVDCNDCKTVLNCVRVSVMELEKLPDVANNTAAKSSIAPYCSLYGVLNTNPAEDESEDVLCSSDEMSDETSDESSDVTSEDMSDYVSEGFPDEDPQGKYFQAAMTRSGFQNSRKF